MLKIQSIQPKDNANVAAMIRAVFEEYDAPTAGTVYTDPTTDNLFELFKTPGAQFYIAFNKEQVVGCCGIYPTEGLPKGCAELVKYYVSGEVRGTGVGRQLFEQAEQYALEQGYSQLYIESMPVFNEAVRIYEKVGFKKLTAPLGNSGHFGCDIWLVKNLKA